MENRLFLLFTIIFALLSLFLFLRIRSLRAALWSIEHGVDRVAKGDFTKKLDCKGTCGKSLVQTFNTLLQNMRRFIAGIDSSGDKIDQTVSEITTYTKDIKERLYHSSEALSEIAKSFESQAYAITQTSDRSGKMVGDFLSILEKTQTAKDQSSKTLSIITENIPIFDQLTRMVQENADQSDQINQKMVDLDHRIEQIHRITETVKAISDSTNMLALNASIEAARAGEAGKGFAVVAQEVKKLADESAISSIEISQLVGSIRNEVREISENVQKGKESVSDTYLMATASKEQFMKSVENTSLSVSLIEDIYRLTTNENTVVTEIGTLMEEAARLAASSTASIQETTSSIQEESHFVEGIFQQLQSLNTMTKEIQSQIRGYAKDFIYTEQTKGYIQNGLKILQEIAEKPELAEMHRETCDRALYDAFMKYDFLEFLCVFNHAGDTVGIGIDKDAYDDSMYTNFAHRPYFIEAVKGKDYISTPYISADTSNYCIALAVPVKVQGQIRGVLMADLFLG